MKRLSIIGIAIIFSGCFSSYEPLPKDIFKDVRKHAFFQAKTLEDIQKGYIDLFNAYEHNLNLIKLLEKNNNR